MKEAGLHVRVEPVLRKHFVEICQKQDLTASQVLRAFMRKFIADHNIGRQQELFEFLVGDKDQRL